MSTLKVADFESALRDIRDSSEVCGFKKAGACFTFTIGGNTFAMSGNSDDRGGFISLIRGGAEDGLEALANLFSW
jgi:hypothetical protein